MHISSDAPPSFAVVIGSNRPRRICPEIATWVQHGLRAAELNAVELVDLREVDLPFLDEPIMPAHGRYQHAHTLRWSELVGSYEGFVFVLPQYNWGYPAVLKNALDFLYDEWADKPAGLVSYGSRGGGLAAGQLRQVLQGLHMRVAKTSIELKTDPLMFTPEGGFEDINAAFAEYGSQLTSLATELHQLI